MTPQQQITNQEATIDRLRAEIRKLSKRCQVQQGIINKLRKPKPLTALEKAEQLFKESGQ